MTFRSREISARTVTQCSSSPKSAVLSRAGGHPWTAGPLQQNEDVGMAPGQRGHPRLGVRPQPQDRRAGQVQVGSDLLTGLARADQPALGEPLGSAQAQPRNGDQPVGPWHLHPVPRRDAGLVRDPAVVVDQQERAVHGGQHAAGRLPETLQPLLVVAPQPRLGQLDGGLDQRPDDRAA
jgi:hypothetical protein